MFQLARLHVESLGPADARFDPLTLDFTDGEQPIDSLLWLVNGGGKTVLTKLLFSVVRPDKVALIGADRIERSNYRGDVHPLIHANDTGHVLLEWRAPDGRRLVTGVVMEWKDGHAGDRSNLRRSWYSFAPEAEVVDFDLVCELARRDGHRVRLSGFVNALRAQASPSDPNLVLVADSMRRWIAHLDDLGLDPELFTYQLRMNQDEGGVEKLFQFRKEIDFIRFLLELVCDRGQLEIVADNLAKLSERVAAAPLAELEFDFVRGALAELDPLTRAEAERASAEQEHLLAQARTRRLLHSFRGRLAADEEALLRLEEEAAGYDRERTEHGRVRRRATVNALELALLAAMYERERAQAALSEAEQSKTDARVERDAWRLLDPLVRARAAAAASAELAAQFAEAEREAAPLAERRTQAARQYAGRLAADIAAHRTAQEQANERDRAEGERAAAATSRSRELQDQRIRQQNEQAELDRILQEFTEALLALREQRTLGRSETVAAALERLHAERAAATACAGELAELVERGEDRREQLEQQAAVANTQASAAQAEQTTVRAELERLEQEAAALAADERLGEIAETSEPELEAQGHEVASALIEAASGADLRVIELEAAVRDDRHALRVLNDQGLLPPSRDLEAALELLEADGVNASAGWRFLAHSIPLDRRAALLEHRPELAGAIVLADPLQRRRAETLLRDAGLAPRSVLLVANSQELLDALELDETRFAVPPDPALYDGGHAGEAKRLLEQRLADADSERETLEAGRERDRALARRLNRFLDEEPFPRIRDLHARADALAAQAAAALELHERQRNEARALAEELREWRAEERGLTVRLGEIATAEARLQPLAADEAQEQQRRDRRAELTGTIGQLDQELEQLETTRRTAEQAARQARERAADERAAAERLENQRDTHGLAGDPADAPALPLEQLRASFLELDRVLREATSESDIAARLHAARDEEARLMRECNSYSAEARTRAEELLLSEQASDSGARADALRIADEALERAGAVALSAKHTFDVATAAEETASSNSVNHPEHRLVDLPEPIPADLEAARAAYTAESELQAQETALETRFENLGRQTRDEIQRQSAAREQFDSFASMLSRELADDAELGEAEPAPQPFAGSSGRARAVFERTIDELHAQATAVQAARDAVAEAGKRIQHFVYEPRFTLLATSALRARLESERLAAEAAYLAGELRKRERVLRDSLDQIAVHKQTAVSELAANVERARQDLRAAQRLSQLPDGLGAWAGKQFLRIDADWWVSDEELRARLGVVVEELAHGEAQRLSGIPLLVRALEGAVGRNGFRSRLLKPAISDRGEYVAVTEAGGTSSGGQGATLAILLYCSLCALRAHNRGSRAASRTTLVLDNPIGKASADFLIEKQRAVASALGVQLIYTTGVNDLGALDHFPKLIRLRNDQELRQAARYVHLDSERLNALLAGRNGNGNGYLAAAQLFER